MWSVAVLSDQFSYFILPAHHHVELLHTVYSDRLWTEWKYKCKCKVTATVRCSHSCTDTALGNFLHLKTWVPTPKSSPDFNIWKFNIYTKNKN
jgi:hypothetical protein